VHIDVQVSEGDDEKLEAELKRLTGLGATVVGRRERMGQRWIVMQDPEGNEFCLS
jgi:predicted enzyme related to lactoylglutathione lyase